MALSVRTFGTAFLRHHLPHCALLNQNRHEKAPFLNLGFSSPKSYSSQLFVGPRSNTLSAKLSGSSIEHQPARNSSTQKNRSKCVLTIYRKTEKWRGCNIEIPFSNQTAEKATDLVSLYFGLNQEWDKKLLKTIFLGDDKLDDFEFTRWDDTTLGVQIAGDRSVVFNDKPEEFYVPIEKPVKLSITTTSSSQNRSYLLDFEQIRAITDFSIIALFNSSSFKCVTARSTNLGFGRTIEILGINSG